MLDPLPRNFRHFHVLRSQRICMSDFRVHLGFSYVRLLHTPNHIPSFLFGASNFPMCPPESHHFSTSGSAEKHHSAADVNLHHLLVIIILAKWQISRLYFITSWHAWPFLGILCGALCACRYNFSDGSNPLMVSSSVAFYIKPLILQYMQLLHHSGVNMPFQS